jgi:chromosome segregation ATPase
MMTDPATAIKSEVLHLVELQIGTLRQEGPLNETALRDYRARSEKITELYQKIDRIVRSRIDLQSARAS